MVGPVPPNIEPLAAARARLVGWLREAALPLWERYGVDRERGGYFETLEVHPVTGRIESAGDLRRGRVVSRQLYCFTAGLRLGWAAAQPDPVRHGCDYLFARLRRRDGLFHTSIDSASYRCTADFSLYESAFFLFALAHLEAGTVAGFPFREAAQACLTQLRRGWGKPEGGFEESMPPSMPLQSNPHMHLLEAALAWLTATAQSSRWQPCWRLLAEEIVDLALQRFIDPGSGVLREFFGSSWQPMHGDAGRIVEPGHQFEWAWLLFEWAASPHCPERQRVACEDAARRLIAGAERWGVDPLRGVACNEVWDDMTAKDVEAKLWPQTERVKAWCAMLDRAATVAEARTAGENLEKAVDGMTRFLQFEPAGLWHELQLADGRFSPQPCKASSFYHIVCAIETLHRTVDSTV